MNTESAGVVHLGREGVAGEEGMGFCELVDSRCQMRAVARSKGERAGGTAVLRSHLAAGKQQFLGQGVLEVVAAHKLDAQSLHERHIVLQGDACLHIGVVLFLKSGLVAGNERILIAYIGPVRHLRPGGRAGGNGVEYDILIAHFLASVVERGGRVAGACTHAGLVPVLNTAGDIHLEGEVVGEVDVNVGAQVVAPEPHIVYDTVLVKIASAYEVAYILASSGDADIVVVPYCSLFEDKVEVIGIAEYALRVVAVSDVFYLGVGVVPGYPVQVGGKVVPVGVARAVEKFNHIGIAADGKGSVVGHAGAGHIAAPGGDENYSVCTFHSIDRSGSRILENGNVGDFGRVEIREVPFHSVHEYQRRTVAGGADASDIDLGVILSRESAGLAGHKARELASQHIGDIVRRRGRQGFIVDGGYGACNAALLLHSVTYDHHFLQKGRIVFECHIEDLACADRLPEFLEAELGKEQYGVLVCYLH